MIGTGVERSIPRPAAGLLGGVVAFAVLAATLPAAEHALWFYLLGVCVGTVVELAAR